MKFAILVLGGILRAAPLHRNHLIFYTACSQYGPGQRDKTVLLLGVPSD